jgi:hypothetical protein
VQGTCSPVQFGIGVVGDQPDKACLPVVEMITDEVADNGMVFGPVPGIHDAEFAVDSPGSNVDLSSVREFASTIGASGVLEPPLKTC